MPDAFSRSVEQIDHDLHEQVQKRENGVAEILHGCFMATRADAVIDRLIEERCRAMACGADEQPVQALPHARLM